MSMLYVLIPLALGLLSLAVWALLWAIKSGQFDDLESHGWSVVLDDDQKPMAMEDEQVDDDQVDNEPVADEQAGEARASAIEGRTRMSGVRGLDGDNRNSAE